MSEVGPINGGLIPQRVAAGHNTPGEHGTATMAPATQDEVEISSMARALSLLEAAPDIRMDKVMAVRQAIANGDYETDDKINQTIDRLMIDVYA